MNFELFVDINNLFNKKYMNSHGFYDDQGKRDYFKSLHLSMYKDKEFNALIDVENGLYIAGEDKPGDLKSDDKPYINMPNREFLNYRNLRCFQFGVRIDF